MTGTDAILVALLVVLVVAVAHRSGDGPRGRRGFRSGGDHGVGCGGGTTFPVAAHQQYPGGLYNPYTVLNKQIGLLRGARHDAYGQPRIWERPHGLDRYHQSGASIRPHQIAAAERDAWFSADSPEGGDVGEGFEPNGAATAGAGAALPSAGPAAAAAAMDYNGYIADLIVDPRTRDNHSKWLQEMGPWSGGPLIVDNMDEAMEATTHFVGLRRPQPVAQYNPLQLTERDTWTYIQNSPFRFNG